jgi:hypothetical protein
MLSVFSNRVSMKIPGPKGDKITGGRRKTYQGKFSCLYCSETIIRVMVWRAMSCAKYDCLERMGKEEMHTGFW